MLVVSESSVISVSRGWKQSSEEMPVIQNNTMLQYETTIYGTINSTLGASEAGSGKTGEREGGVRRKWEMGEMGEVVCYIVYGIRCK